MTSAKTDGVTHEHAMARSKLQEALAAGHYTAISYALEALVDAKLRSLAPPQAAAVPPGDSVTLSREQCEQLLRCSAVVRGPEYFAEVREEEFVSYHPDPKTNAEVSAGAAEAERLDLKAGYPPRRWRCPRCRASHARGFFPFGSNEHRCLRCGYQGPLGVLWDPQTEPVQEAAAATQPVPTQIENYHLTATAPTLFIVEEVELGGGHHELWVAHGAGAKESGWTAPYRKSGSAWYRRRVVRVPYPPPEPEAVRAGENRRGLFWDGEFKGFATPDEMLVACAAINTMRERELAAEPFLEWLRAGKAPPAEGRTEEPSDEELRYRFEPVLAATNLVTIRRLVEFGIEWERKRSLAARASKKMTPSAYEKLIAEDRAWLTSHTPDCLERRHIDLVLAQSFEQEYPVSFAEQSTSSRAPGSVGVTDEEWEALELCVEHALRVDISSTADKARAALRKLNARAGSEGAKTEGRALPDVLLAGAKYTNPAGNVLVLPCDAPLDRVMNCYRWQTTEGRDVFHWNVPASSVHWADGTPPAPIPQGEASEAGKCEKCRGTGVVQGAEGQRVRILGTSCTLPGAPCPDCHGSGARPSTATGALDSNCYCMPCAPGKCPNNPNNRKCPTCVGTGEIPAGGDGRSSRLEAADRRIAHLEQELKEAREELERERSRSVQT